MNLIDEARKYVGVREIKGPNVTNPQISAWIKDNPHKGTDDDVSWCSAFVNFICKECGFERSHSNRSRRWLAVGESIPIEQAEEGDIVIVKRERDDPGPSDHDSLGHVGFFVKYDSKRIWIFGGNQNIGHDYDEVSEKDYDPRKLLGVRRLSRVS